MNEETLKQIEKIWGNRICMPGYAEGADPTFRTVEHLKEQYDSLSDSTGMIFLMKQLDENGFVIERIAVDKSFP